MANKTQLASTIFVKLLDEGTDVWRPVQAEQLSPNVFLIPESTVVPDDELWEFYPSARVRCEPKDLSGGECLVAVEQV